MTPLYHAEAASLGRVQPPWCFRGIEPIAVHKTDTMTLWMAFLRDSKGNPLAMMSEVPATSY